MPTHSLTLGYVGLPETPDFVLSVDGMADRGPNLSHWPGNRTPARFKADLSTGICFRFAKAGAAEQEEFLSGASMVLNDHYDTDGFGSLLAVLRPEVALPREEVLLEAAATGDFQAFQGERGFAIDRIVLRLAHASSPVHEEFAGLSGPAKDLARYRWLIEHADEVLDDPGRFAETYADELATIQGQLEDPGITCNRFHGEGLAVIESPGPVHRMVLNTIAGNLYRVLHIETGATDGARYRFHDRTESWFEVQTFQPLPRVNLKSLADDLQLLEGDSAPARWCCDPGNEPVPELYFGRPGPQAYGQITRELAPSRLAPERVVERFADFLTSSN